MLLQFVQEILVDPKSRIIIFSLFGELLRTLRNRWRKVGVHAELCRGDVHCRRNAMRAFQRDLDGDGVFTTNRIILLSSKAAASEADLKNATHVILMDPVPGSASESFAQERQTIGRAVRQGMDEMVAVSNAKDQAHNDTERSRKRKGVMKKKWTHQAPMMKISANLKIRKNCYRYQNKAETADK